MAAAGGGLPARRGAAHDRLRIAYVSADFREHPVSRMIARVIERHDRARFAVTAVALNPSDGGALRRRLDAAFERTIDATRMSDRQLAARLDAEEIDIAIDLSGYTQNGRPAIFAARAAPVQVNWFGYPGTMSAPFIDYIVANSIVIPEAARHCYTEAIVALPEIYYANDAARAIPAAAPSRAEHGLPERGFVFSCFNAGYKLTPEMFERWMRLVAAVEGSVLWLYADNEWSRANLAREAEARGVAPERLVFAAPADWPAHLSRMRLADLFLDTLPYNAHTTASDALWAGLPLVTVAGRSFPARVAASLLTAIGLPELIADSPEGYESVALDLARDPGRLAAMKAKLERNRAAGKLFDAARFCRAIEAAYLAMWERHRSGQKPQGFAVPPET